MEGALVFVCSQQTLIRSILTVYVLMGVGTVDGRKTKVNIALEILVLYL